MKSGLLVSAVLAFGLALGASVVSARNCPDCVSGHLGHNMYLDQEQICELPGNQILHYKVVHVDSSLNFNFQGTSISDLVYNALYEWNDQDDGNGGNIPYWLMLDTDPILTNNNCGTSSDATISLATGACPYGRNNQNLPNGEITFACFNDYPDILLEYKNFSGMSYVYPGLYHQTFASKDDVQGAIGHEVGHVLLGVNGNRGCESTPSIMGGTNQWGQKIYPSLQHPSEGDVALARTAIWNTINNPTSDGNGVCGNTSSSEPTPVSPTGSGGEGEGEGEGEDPGPGDCDYISLGSCEALCDNDFSDDGGDWNSDGCDDYYQCFGEYGNPYDAQYQVECWGYSRPASAATFPLVGAELAFGLIGGVLSVRRRRT